MLKKCLCIVLPILTGSLLAMASISRVPGEGHAVAADDAMTAAAIEFLNILRPDLRRQAVLPLDDANRLDWHYVPREREGVLLAAMNTEERRAARSLLRACLSDAGYLKVETIMELELVLREEAEARGRSAPHRDPELYAFTIFGSPGGEPPWGWRIEGHHLSLNFSAVTKTLTTVTPAFWGANPAEVRTGRRAGWRVLAAEEELARDLLESLDEQQRSVAIITDHAPRDIIMSPGQTANRLGEPKGLALAAMHDAQRDLVMSLLHAYLSNYEDTLERAQLDRITSAGFENIHFAWAGSEQIGEGHYYRLHGLTFVIEYDNTQNGANHIHSVFRDLEHDFGGEALMEHYRRHHSDE